MSLSKKQIQSVIKKNKPQAVKQATAKRAGQAKPVRTIRRIGAALDSSLRAGLLTVIDPGNGGTIHIELRGQAYCEVVTAGAETRALPPAVGFGNGQELTVFLKTPGNVTVTGAADGSVVLEDAGDLAIFRVSPAGLNNTDRVWRVVHESDSAFSLADGDYGDIVVSGGGTVWTIDVGVVTYAKIQDVSATDRILGRFSAGAGPIEEAVITDFVQSLLNDGDAATFRTSIGAGTGSGTIIGSTGASDNAVIRADGTGGVTIQPGSVFFTDAGWLSTSGAVNTGVLVADAGVQIRASTAPTVLKLMNADGTDGGFHFQQSKVTVASNANVFIGYQAGDSLTSGLQNVGIGVNALTANTTGQTNVAIGPGALADNLDGSSNVALGVDALVANTSGIGNLALGSGTLNANTTGNSNTAIGSGALENSIGGGKNTGIGVDALIEMETGGFNVGIGPTVIGSLITGNTNIGIGAYALYSLIEGNDNIGVGNDTGYGLYYGDNNVVIGNGVTITDGDNQLNIVDTIHSDDHTVGNLQFGPLGAPVLEIDGTTPGFAFFNGTPTAISAAYTPTNVTTDRSYDANSTSIDEIADVLGTLIADLQAKKIIGGP